MSGQGGGRRRFPALRSNVDESPGPGRFPPKAKPWELMVEEKDRFAPVDDRFDDVFRRRKLRRTTFGILEGGNEAAVKSKPEEPHGQQQRRQELQDEQNLQESRSQARGHGENDLSNVLENLMKESEARYFCDNDLVTRSVQHPLMVGGEEQNIEVRTFSNMIKAQDAYGNTDIVKDLRRPVSTRYFCRELQGLCFPEGKSPSNAGSAASSVATSDAKFPTPEPDDEEEQAMEEAAEKKGKGMDVDSENENENEVAADAAETESEGDVDDGDYANNQEVDDDEDDFNADEDGKEEEESGAFD